MAALSTHAVRGALFTLLLSGALAACGNSTSGTGGTGGNGATTPSADDLGSSSGAAADLALPPPPPADLALPPDMVIVSDATKFLGSWIYGAAATATTDCPGQTPSTDISANTFMVALKSANTITLSAGAALDCSLDFTVAGSTATLVPGQMCTIMSGGVTATVSPDKGGTFLTSDGVTAKVMSTAKVSAGIVQCTAGIGAPAAHR